MGWYSSKLEIAQSEQDISPFCKESDMTYSWKRHYLIGLVSVSGGGGGSHRLALCQGPRSCRADGEGHKKVMWRHTKVKVSEIEGAPMVPLCLKFGAIPTIIYNVTAFEKNGTRHFSLIGRHLESVSRTIPVFNIH